VEDKQKPHENCLVEQNMLRFMGQWVEDETNKAEFRLDGEFVYSRGDIEATFRPKGLEHYSPDWYESFLERRFTEGIGRHVGFDFCKQNGVEAHMVEWIQDRFIRFMVSKYSESTDNPGHYDEHRLISFTLPGELCRDAFRTLIETLKRRPSPTIRS